MAIDYDTLMAASDLGRRFSYTERDVMLYALGVGMGRDPLDSKELPFVFEGGDGPQTLPSLAAVLTRSDLPRKLPINYPMMLHGEQRLSLHRPLPPSGELIADTRLTEVIDKGPGKGVLIYYETVVRTLEDDAPLYATGGTLFARGDGGFGGPPRAVPPVRPIPDRAPDFTDETQTRPEQALLYRLTGDHNPLHADPEMARKAGFPAPILHGLCTYGVACRAVTKTACAYETARIAGFDVRFTSPVFPGETLLTEVWVDGEVASFRCIVRERNVVAINNGRALLK